MEEKDVDEQGTPRSLLELPGPMSKETNAPQNPRSSTSSTTADLEELREEARRNNPNGLSRIDTGVSVEQAEASFAHLQRELSGLSRASQASSRRKETDVEKGTGATPSSPSSEEEPFDLESYLRGGLAAEQEAGIRPKHIGVYWDGLTVKGMGGMTNIVKTFPDVIVNFFDVLSPTIRMLGLGKHGTEATLLDGFKGVAKPGEMILVLGKPGSGCTTFLKTIANQRYGYTDVSGDVLYGPFTANEFRQYRGEVVYNQEDDIHHATLTVEQTLGFALDTKIAGKLPAGMTKARFKEEVITMLLNMFNIAHTRKTVVGGHFVRGISGGEKKRVSVAEMLCSNACVLSWDNSTRGLDASTALDFVKSLRVYANLYKTTTFVSLYQASENIYNHFDKVLVIDSGRCVYFGPASDARSYFEGLGFLPRPRQTTPDYVTGCTDEFEREYSEGRSVENVPHNPETLAEAFRQSKYAKILEEEMATYRSHLAEEEEQHKDFQIAVKESKQKGARR
jgi:ATP-binding cassette, subfamily G (WHITE), member 2, SNQ2